MKGMIKNFGRGAVALAIASAAVIVAPTAASAAPAMVTGHVNVRVGPGVNYAVVDTLRYGAVVDVRQCKAKWCFVRHAGRDGWVSRSYLAHAVKHPHAPHNDVWLSLFFGFGGNGHYGRHGS